MHYLQTKLTHNLKVAPPTSHLVWHINPLLMVTRTPCATSVQFTSNPASCHGNTPRGTETSMASSLQPITPSSSSWPRGILPLRKFPLDASSFLPSLGFAKDLFPYNSLLPPSSAPHQCCSRNIIPPVAFHFWLTPAMEWKTWHLTCGTSPKTLCYIMLTPLFPTTNSGASPSFQLQHCDG